MDNQFNSLPAPNVTPYIVCSIIEAFCCGGIFGIIALVMSILASSDVKNGNIASATDKLKWAKILLIVGVVLGVLGGVIATVMCVVYGGLIGAMSYSF